MPQNHRLLHFSGSFFRLDFRSSLCPFLYPTFTTHSLIQPLPKSSVAGHRFKSSDNARKRRTQIKHEKPKSPSRVGVFESSTIRRSINPDDPPDVQEQDEQSEQKAAASSPRMPSDASTLTEPERRIFEKLYDSMYYGTKQKEAADLGKYAQLLEGSGADRGDDKALDDIFNDLLQKSESRNQASNEAFTENDSSTKGASRRPSDWILPPHFKGTKSLKFAGKLGRQSLSSGDTANNSQPDPMAEQQAMIERMARVNLVRINHKLEDARTDVEIWRVLDVEVFSRMRTLNGRFEADEKQRRKVMDLESQKIKKKKKSKKGQEVKSKEETEGTSGKEETVEAEKEPDAPSSQDPPTDQPPLSNSTSVIPNPIHPLQIVTPIYGPSLLHAARLYRTRFPRSPYALSLLSKIKEYGPFSYVLGASTELYNELLYLNWVYYRDLDSCAQLIEEMVARGLQIDRSTVAVIEDAKRVRNTEKSEGALVRKTALGDAASAEAKEGQMYGGGVSGGNRRAEISDGQSETLGDASEETNVDLGRQIVHVPERKEPPAVTYGTVYAGWWRMQGTSAGWRRWKNAHEEAVKQWAEDQRRAEEEKRAAEEERMAAAKAASEMGGDETAEPEITVFNAEEDEVEGEENMAADGAG